MKSIFILLTSLLTISLCSHGQDTMQLKRVPYKLTLAVDKNSFYEEDIKATPYVLPNKTIQLYPGETVYIEVEQGNGIINNLKAVNAIKDSVGEHVTWKSNQILGSKVISSKRIAKLFKNEPDKGWVKFNKRYKDGFATFSVPLFSLDKNTCIVYKAGRCGSLCGHGGTSLYKKIKGKWTFVKVVGMIWIS